MKAATNNKYGAPNVLAIEEVERPVIGAEEVLIRVHASTVTEGDRRLRSSDFPGMSWLPGRLMMGLTRPKNRVPGTNFSGQIVAVGEGVTSFAPGDDVFGSSMHSAHAEYLSMPADSTLAKMPTNVSYEEAAAIPYGAVTALIFLRDLGKVQRGQRVLIVGASGGVGRFAVQVAHHYGAEVTGVCSRDQDLVRSLGADHIINYTSEDFTRSGERYDVIFDISGTTRFSRCKDSMTESGRYLSVYMVLTLLFQMMMTALIGNRRAIAGIAMGTQADIEEVRDLTELGAIRPVIDQVFPLEQIEAAHTHFESKRHSGSVVVSVTPTPARHLVAVA